MKSGIPRHVGIIPDGNRRWARARGLEKACGYAHGIEPGLRLVRSCRAAGIPELSVYGFTQDNVRRPRGQVEAFRAACAEMARVLVREGASVRAVGQAESDSFPPELRGLLSGCGDGDIKVNLLVNYGWKWDLDGIKGGRHRSWEIPPVDLVVRWGGGRRLSGFLPIQSVYADFYVVDDLWPDFKPEHLDQALEWYGRQDRTLGG